jgi:hypothetical protein
LDNRRLTIAASYRASGDAAGFHPSFRTSMTIIPAAVAA